MKKYTFIILFLSIIINPVSANSVDCEEKIAVELYPNEYRFKSLKGWIRILNNKKKSRKYNIDDNKRKLLLPIFEDCYKSKSVGIIK